MSKLPEPLLLSLKGAPGFDQEAFVKVHNSGEQVTSIRVNPSKPVEPDESFTPEALFPNSANPQITTTPVPWCSSAMYLSARPSFTFDPSFHAGAYYVQEASSMFIDHIIQQIFPADQPQRVLDLCAAPGGKSTLLSARLNDSFIVSNEVIKTRVTILAENISKWGSSNVVVTHNDPKDFKKLPGYFDLMVVDAPCSGSGLFRKDVKAIEEWSETSVELCSLRQQRILDDAIGSLKEGGYLIYSTCSYSRDEDESICDWIIDSYNIQPVAISVEEPWNIVEAFSEKHHAPSYRFYPDKVKGEGFFVACFKQEAALDEYFNTSPSLTPLLRTEKEIITPFMRDVDDLNFFKQKETIIAFPKKFAADVATIQQILNVRKSGVAVGTIKGKDLIPHHELALSGLVHPRIPVVNLDYDNAIRYLKRHDLAVQIEAKGWTLAAYRNLNLGWMKVLQNRINNYYPTDWRILKH